jgi:CRISPR-associated endonuclease Csn1
MGVKTVGFDRIRTLLRLPAQARFNLESERCTALDGDATAACLAERSRFGRAWRRLPPDRRIAVVDKLVGDDGEAALVDWLMAGFGLDRARAERIAAAPLPDGHCRLGLRAIRAVLPHMEAGLGFHDAAARAGFDPAPMPDRGPAPHGRLPYYGEWLRDNVVGSGDPRDVREKRFGRFANPTVHIGLGQLRRVVNGLIARYGPPDEIVVEFARALKHSTQRQAEIRRTQQRHRARNDAHRDALTRLGLPVHARNLLKMRLWEELNPDDPDDRCCLYSGEPIDLPTLMSEQVDIDHLIPFSTSLDDSAANKTVCMRYANRHKRCRTPFAAFATSPTIDGRPYRWDDILARAGRLPTGKHWRFDADAEEKFAAAGGYIARQLNETGWLARVARRYLEAVCDRRRIWVVPGRLTAMIRAGWRLDSLLCDRASTHADRGETSVATEAGPILAAVKNRADHRHHAIDALVAAMTDRALLRAMAEAHDDERGDIVVDPPWRSLRDDLAGALRRMIVSHKVDHGRGGKLHQDTAYGLIANPAQGGANLVYRKPVASLSEADIARIRNPALRDAVAAHVAAERANGVGLAEALHKLGSPTRLAQIKHGLRRIRLLKTAKPDYLVPIRDRRDGRIYKAYSAGENFCVDIFATIDGDWNGEAVRRFDANRNHRPRWPATCPGARLVMRLHKGDAVRIEQGGQARIMVVHRLEAAHGRLKFAAHNETGRLDHRHDSDSDPLRWLVATYARLKMLNAEPVRVDALGRVFRLRARAWSCPDAATPPPPPWRHHDRAAATLRHPSPKK